MPFNKFFVNLVHKKNNQAMIIFFKDLLKKFFYLINSTHLCSSK